MIDANFIDLLFNSNGNRLSEKMFLQVKSKHCKSFEIRLQQYLNIVEKKLSAEMYDNMTSYLEANYSTYAEEGYKTGF